MGDNSMKNKNVSSRRCHQCHTYGCNNFDNCNDAVKTAHTPTPFRLELHQGTGDNPLHEIHMIFDGDHFGFCMAQLQHKDNAEYIVRAVNSHEALLNALDPFIKGLGFTHADVEYARKVVAQVEGK